MNANEFDIFVEQIRPHALATEDVELELEFGTRLVDKPEGLRREFNGTLTAVVKVHGGAVDTGLGGAPITPSRVERARRLLRRAIERVIGRLA